MDRKTENNFLVSKTNPIEQQSEFLSESVKVKFKKDFSKNHQKQLKRQTKYIMTDPRIQSMKVMGSSQEEANTPQSLEDKVIDILRACRGSRKLVLLIVAIALLLDNMLLTSVGE